VILLDEIKKEKQTCTNYTKQWFFLADTSALLKTKNAISVHTTPPLQK